MRRILIFLAAAIATTASFAQHTQKTVITGRTFDTTVNKGLPFATLSVLLAKDSTLAGFGKADSAGRFRLNPLSPGNYLITASYVGYAPAWKNITINGEGSVDAGDLIMTDVTMLKGVTVSSYRPPVVLNNDTLEFNSEHFKVQPNAVVEDLLKKMPGVTVESDGTIKVNGETIRKVMVNGREFFTGDPKMATKNLPADAIDKVQVYDRKSDQSMFTGIDDGNTTKTLNLKIKKDRDHALFGKLTGGGGIAGRDGKFDAQGNLNRFSGDRQESALAMANNTNRQGFSMSDILNFTGALAKGARNGGGISIRVGGDADNGGLPVTGLGQNQPGIATTVAAGVNYNDSWKASKADVNTSATASEARLSTGTDTHTQYLLPVNPYTRDDQASQQKNGSQERLNMDWDKKIDSATSVKITPVLTLQQNDFSKTSAYQSIDATGQLLNNGSTLSAGSGRAFDFQGTALLRHRFSRKGRTISANVTLGYNNSHASESQYSDNRFYQSGSLLKDSLIDQTRQREGRTTSAGINLSYTEPAGKTGLVELLAFGSINSGKASLDAYDVDHTSGKHDLLNTQLTNHYSSIYSFSGGGFNFRKNYRSLSFTAGATVQAAQLNGRDEIKGMEVSRNYTDLLPNLVFNYSRGSSRNIQLTYTASTLQPNMRQLQPVADISDPLNITQGNPALGRQYDHHINLHYFSADIVNRSSLVFVMSATFSRNAIVYADTYTATGIRTSIPVNARGADNLFGFADYSFNVKKLAVTFDLSLSGSLSHLTGFTNGQEDHITNSTVSPRVSLRYDKDQLISVQLGARLSFNHAAYTLQPALSNSYRTNTFDLDLLNYLPGHLILSNLVSLTTLSGRTAGYNNSYPVWNVSLAEGFLKNRRAEIKLAVQDLLNMNQGISRSTNQNYITDQRYNVLTRYFLLSFTYSLNKSGLGGGPRTMIRTM